MQKAKKRKPFNFIIIAFNLLIVLVVFLFALRYVQAENDTLRKERHISFSGVTDSLASVTANYLDGEKSVCASWGKHLDSDPLTIEDAIAYVSSAKSVEQAVGHVVFEDTLKGLSTTAKRVNPTDFTVDYSSYSLFEEISDEGVHISRAYTNPSTGDQTIAFYRKIRLIDPNDPTSTVNGFVLRAMPIDSLSSKWVFPIESYASTEVALINDDGDYIIKDSAFKNSNFFEYYYSYNANPALKTYDPNTTLSTEAFKETIQGESGHLVIWNSKEPPEQALIAHAEVDYTNHWTLISYVLLDDIDNIPIDWLLIVIITIGLLALVIFDMVIFIIYNNRLKATAELADHANKAKTDFLSTMSHDIRTPMNAIIGLTNIASRKIENKEVVVDALRKIDLASNHLLTLINDILDISKVESGALSINPLAFSLSEVMENLVSISNPMVKAKSLSFNFRVHNPEHEYFYSDKLRLNQIFINILSNAIKYTPEGGSVTVDVFEKQSEKENCSKIIYRVQDTGIGMSEEFQKKMYEPFSRQTDSRVNAIQGTGLGLAITKQMVNVFGGEITCESKQGVGTTFTVSLDLPLAEKPEQEMVLPPMNVLFADDDPVLLMTAKDTLSSLGLNVETVASGREAIDRVLAAHGANNQYKIVILDWQMPDIDGLEVARQIREKIDKSVPIIMVSSYDWTEIELDAKKIGIDGFIYKPLFRSKVYEQIVNTLNLENETTETAGEVTDLVGMHVLVVEDNEINWEIVSTLLGMYGVTSVRAENGAAALRMIEEKSEVFDLVFMDIQMPVMNGLDATRAIRKLEDPYAQNIPIIAMTADAFSENIAECLAAGMNGHLAKPIDINLVIKEIQKIKEGKPS